MHSDVRQHVRKCEICQSLEQVKHEAPPGELTVVHPFEVLAVDFIGPLPKTSKQNQYLLCAVDLFSRWIEAAATRRCDGDTVVKFLDSVIIPRFGRPVCLLSDRAQCFLGHKMKDFLADCGIKHLTSAAFTPKSNGCVERYNRTLIEALRAEVMGRRNWDDKLPGSLFAIRSAVHSILGRSPAQLLMGFQPFSPGQLAERACREMELEEAAATANLQVPELEDAVARIALLEEIRDEAATADLQAKLKRREKHVKHSEFKIGDLVMVFDKQRKSRPQAKFDPLWNGPYKIVKQRAVNIWDVCGHDGKSLTHIHSDRLKHFRI